MRKVVLSSALVLISAFKAFSASVQWGVVTIDEFSGWGIYDCDHALYVSAEGVTGGNLAGYKTTSQSATHVILSGQNWATTASYGHMWRQLYFGDAVDQDSVMGNFDDYFFCFWGGYWDDEFSDLSIELNQAVYLGFFVEGDAANALFGWVELGFDGSSVYVVNSAMETTGVGIYAGTYTPVPEPATDALALAGVAALAASRWRKRRTGRVAACRRVRQLA